MSHQTIIIYCELNDYRRYPRINDISVFTPCRCQCISVHVDAAAHVTVRDFWSRSMTREVSQLNGRRSKLLPSSSSSSSDSSDDDSCDSCRRRCNLGMMIASGADDDSFKSRFNSDTRMTGS
jgi:hypothetical protein